MPYASSSLSLIIGYRVERSNHLWGVQKVQNLIIRGDEGYRMRIFVGGG